MSACPSASRASKQDTTREPSQKWVGRASGNGELLTLAQGQFDVFLTVDRNVAFQNEVNRFAIAVVVLHAKSNRLSDLRPLVPELLSVLSAVMPGQVVPVGN